ncbi:MAG: PQQ-binding-like beta-propeller repeat protein [Verrucomicrobiota bacterium]
MLRLLRTFFCLAALLGAGRTLLHAQDIGNPKEAWIYRLATGWVDYSSPALSPSGDTVYVGIVRQGSGRVLAIAAATGDKRWELTLPQRIDSTPTVAPNGTVYIGCYDGKMYALDPDPNKPDSQRVKWFKQTDAPISSSAAIGADGTIYFGSGDE